jgi:hypothetical protein
MAGRLTEQLRKATREQSRLHPVDMDDGLDGGRGETESDRAHGPFGWVSLLVVAALVVGGWFVMRQLQADSKMQDCVMSGRKNCAPVDTDSMHGTSTPP